MDYDINASYRWTSDKHNSLNKLPGINFIPAGNNADYQEYLRWCEGTGKVADEYITPVESVEAKTQRLLIAANFYQNSLSDENGITAITGYYQSIQLLRMIGKLSTTCTEVDANYAWYKGVWTLYATRKATLEVGGDLDLDFSSCGVPPYSITSMTQSAENLLSTITL